MLGEDVSEYQGLDVDWSKVPGQFIYQRLWAWRKAEDRLDRSLVRNVSEGLTHGKTMGGYLRAAPTRWSPQQACDKLIDLCDQNQLLRSESLIPAIDIEPTVNDGGLLDSFVDWPKWTNDFIECWAAALDDGLDSDLVIYTSGSYVDSLLGGQEDWPEWVHLWVGHTKKYALTEALRNGSEENWAGKTQHSFNGRTKIHQYSTTGRVPGITPVVDLNVLMPGVTLDQLIIGRGGQMAAPRIITREEWGARFHDGYDDAPLPAREIYAHHDVAGWVAPDAGIEAEKAHMRKLDSIGETNFASGVSYTYVMFPSGDIGEGHSLDRAGAHTKDHNYSGRAICYVGNYMNDKLTEAQKNSTAWLLAWNKARGVWTRNSFTGPHSSVYATACPGDDVRANLAEMNRRAALITNPGSGGGGGEDDMTPEQDAKLDLVYKFLGLTAGAPLNPDTGKPATLFEVMWGQDELIVAKLQPFFDKVKAFQQETHDSLIKAIKALPTSTGPGGSPVVPLDDVLTAVDKGMTAVLQRTNAKSTIELTVDNIGT